MRIKPRLLLDLERTAFHFKLLQMLSQNSLMHLLRLRLQSYLFVLASMIFLFSSCNHKKAHLKEKQPTVAPKIVNIINFIRDIEPRDPNITKDTLYQTVVSQVDLMRKYHLKGTFLLQYDALIDEKYQKLLKSLPKDSIEIGAWWEIPQPMVENAGLKWRGRYPWDWHADVGFATGYTPQEREKLVDVYMEKFKSIFGYYPKSAASWFIDAHTLNYMYEKYHIVASANCKDQYGTDGYTLWGGYWNQAYYPSKVNSYMPAQHAENQIPVPIFRMLGSDPIRQYDTGFDADRQGVITLEPVYPQAGGSKKWVDWYFKEFVKGEPMAFAYVQAGQENSFIWRQVKKGFQIQLPLIAKLRDAHKVKVETLEESGTWFKEQFKTTPATSVTVTEDMEGSDKKTEWFNSKYYRANILWEKNTLRIRDIHLFDEKIKSPYYDQVLTSNQASFFTLPVIDGYLWSTSQELAGLKLYYMKDGEKVLMEGGTPKVVSKKEGVLQIDWPLTSLKGDLVITLKEKTMQIQLKSAAKINWFLDLITPKKDQLPFVDFGEKRINYKFQGERYSIHAQHGSFSTPNENLTFRLSPKENNIQVDFSIRD